MNHFISQGQITDSIIILMSVEVISVITERFTQSVTIIQHRRYTVKTESIEFIRLPHGYEYSGLLDQDNQRKDR